MMTTQAAPLPSHIVTSAGPSFVSQLSLTQSESDDSFVSRHDQQPQIIVSPPSQEFSISNHTPVIKSSPPQQRQREARSATPESIDESTFEDASDSFFDANATPMPLDEEEDGVDPEFQRWQRSMSLEDVKEIISPPRPSFARAQTDSYVGEMPRPRSHFSIPDVVVTSCEEEGEEMYFEMKVEPTRRKMTLPSQMSVIDAEYTQTREVPKVANVKAKHSSKGGIFRIKSKPPPLHISTQEISGPMMQPFNATPLASVISPEKSSLAKRMRKSSLSSLFGRAQKDREASPPPPSPTLPAEWQGDERTISPPLDSPISPHSSETPLSATYSTSEASSASTHSPNTPTLEHTLKRTLSKKELKAKMKEEKALVKERERIDKLVRKHDKMKQKATAKQQSSKGNSNVEGSMTASSSGSSNESPKKKRATNITTKRSQGQMKSSSANARAMKAADFCVRHVSPHRIQPPPPRPVKSAIRGASNDSKSSFGESERPQSETIVERDNVQSIMRPSSIHNAGKHRSGTSFKASNGVSFSSQRVSFVRKRQSPKMDLHVEKVSTIMASNDTEEVMEEEEAVEEKEINIENDPTIIASTKRMTLLESLYKDIEEMEMRFEEEYSITTRRCPLGVKENHLNNSVAFPMSIVEQAIPI